MVCERTSFSLISQSKRKFSHPSRVSPTLSRNQRQLYVGQMMFRHRRTCGFLTYAGVSSSSHLGCILNLQYLAQSIPAAFTSAHVGSDSYNVAFMCVLFCRFCPVLPARSCMYTCASCTLPCLPRVCTIYIICVRVIKQFHPSIHRGVTPKFQHVTHTPPPQYQLPRG